MRSLTQEELAKRLRTTRETVARFESGKGKAGFDTLSRLADVLGVEETDLFRTDEPIRIEESKHTVDDCYRVLGEAIRSPRKRVTLPEAVVCIREALAAHEKIPDLEVLLGEILRESPKR